MSRSALVALAWLTAFLLSASALHAGNMILDLRIDPTTTAYNGVPASGGFTGASTRSGPGTWQLFAYDDLGTDFGIQSFNVALMSATGGAIPAAISNRSPRATWDDGTDFHDAGFASTRSGTNVQPIMGSQVSADETPLIGGFGQAASNFTAKSPGAASISSSNGQWGNYASSLNFGSTHPIFLAEGTYTGAAPVIDLAHSSVSVFGNPNLTFTTGVLSSNLTMGVINGGGCICGIEVFNDRGFLNVIATTPGSVSHTFNVNVDLPQFGPATWSNPLFVSYNGSGSRPAGVDLPTFNSTFNTYTFTWNTTKAPIGNYLWAVQAFAQGYADAGYVFVSIVAVPEPSAIGLLTMATMGGLARRRR
jgi:hypothetical protein